MPQFLSKAKRALGYKAVSMVGWSDAHGTPEPSPQCITLSSLPAFVSPSFSVLLEVRALPLLSRIPGPCRTPGVPQQPTSATPLPPLSFSGFLPKDRTSRQLKAEGEKNAQRLLNLQFKYCFLKASGNAQAKCCSV